MFFSEMFGAEWGASLTSFFAPAFFAVFLPVFVVGYAVTPNKLKRYFLLAASYGFFWLVSGKLIGYLLASTVSMYLFGLWLDRLQTNMKTALHETEKERRAAVKKSFVRRQRLVVFLAVLLHIGVLLLVKYAAFLSDNLNWLLGALNIPLVIEMPRYLMPVGISFFTMQALSYIFDVHRGVVKAERNFFRLALFIAFFPQIVEGPICRYAQTASALWEAGPITYRNLTFGLQRFLFGMMKKLVVADRLDPLVRLIFNEYQDYGGGVIAVGALCYSVQLYMDFSGSLDAVLGTAQIVGIELPENFQRPFFSKTVSEFWKRWHITLGTWFKDYVFYPVTSSDVMKKLTSRARRKLGNHYGPLLAGAAALFCVWFSNGLWHGPAWNYVFFGMYHFALILGGSLISPLVKATNQRLHINAGSFLYRTAQMLRTALLVVIGELFFRADGLRAGFEMFRKMICDFSFASFNGDLLALSGVDRQDFIIVGLTLIIVFVVSVFNEKGVSLRETLAEKGPAIRWAVYYALILYIVIFGAYGFGYEPVDPLYAQF